MLIENEKLHNYKTFANLLAFLTSIIIFVLAFSISVNAEGNNDSSIQVKPEVDGHTYFYLKDFLYELGINFSDGDEYLQDYFDQYYEGQELPEDLVVPLLDQSISDLFELDLSNNPFLIEDSLLNKSVNKYEPIYNSNNVLSGWNTQSVSIKNCNFTYYALMKNPSTGRYVLYLFDDSAPILLSSYNNNGYHTDGFYSVDRTNQSNRLYNFYIISFDGNNRFNTSSASNSLANPSENYIGSTSAPDFLMTYSLFSHICYSNLSCYATSPLERTGSSNGNQRIYYADNGEYVSEIYGSPDYLIPKKSDLSSGDDEGDVYPDGSGGSYGNNLFLTDADFIFKHKAYYPPYSSVINSGDHVPNGNIIFSAVLNDYQIDHADEFDIVIDFTFDFDVNYQNHSEAFSLFKSTSSILGNKKNLKLNFRSTEYTCPLSDFVDDNNQYTLTFKDVFDNLSTSDTDLSGLLAQMRELTSVEYNVFNLYCNAHLVSNGASSGGYSEYYNPINKRGLTTDQSINTNSNPYVVNPSDQASDDPDSSNIQPDYNVPGPGGTDASGGNNSSSSNSNSSTGSITITNNNNNNYNPVNTLNNSDGNPFSKLINNIFGDGTVSEGSIGENNVNSLDGVVGSNGFLRYMNNTLTWIPSSVWAEIAIFVGITLGILVAAFILRIILDFL